MTKRLTIAVAASAALLAGCFARGRLPPRELYRLWLPDSARMTTNLASTGLAAASGTIAIAPYTAAGVYGESGIVYRIDDTQYGVYPSREWALPVASMLGMITEEALRRTPVTTGRVLFDPPSYRTYDYVWQGVVRELEEVDRGRNVYAAVRFDARLVRASDDSLIWSGTARAERAVPQGTMPAIVAALSELSADVITQLAEEARAALARSAASAGRN